MWFEILKPNLQTRSIYEMTCFLSEYKKQNIACLSLLCFTHLRYFLTFSLYLCREFESYLNGTMTFRQISVINCWKRSWPWTENWAEALNLYYSIASKNVPHIFWTKKRRCYGDSGSQICDLKKNSIHILKNELIWLE